MSEVFNKIVAFVYRIDLIADFKNLTDIKSLIDNRDLAVNLNTEV